MPKVELKKSGKDLDKTDVVIGINSKDDYMVVKGLKGSHFEGQTKVLHNIAGQKLIDKKHAELAKADFTVSTSKNRNSVDIEEK